MNFLSSKSKPVWRALAWTGAAGLLACGLAWATVPSLLRYGIESKGTALLGRPVSVGDIDFRPWSLELTLRDLAVATQDGDGAQLSVERLYIDAAWQSLWRLAPVVDALTIEQPVLRLAHTKPNYYDIDDLIERFSQPDDRAPSKPLGFAIHNVSLLGGQVSFHDTVAGQDHQLKDLRLEVPFISNFDAGREVAVAPKLAFNLNGSAFELDGETTPFSDSRQTALNLRLSAVDAAAYARYLPATLPVRLQAGALDLDLHLTFRQQPAMALSLSGDVTAQGVRLARADGQPWLSFPRLKVELKDLQPLKQQVHLGTVSWQAPDLALQRDARGRWLPFATGGAAAATSAAPAAPTTGSPAAPDSTPSRSPTTAKAPAQAAPGWTVQVDDFQLQGGQLAWQDDSTRPAARARASELDLSVQALRWPWREPARFQGQLKLSPVAEAGRPATNPAPAKLRFFGSGTDQAASVSLLVNDLPLALGQSYWSAWLKPSLSGKVQLVGGLGWRAPDLALSLAHVAVDDLRLQQDDTALVSWDRLGGRELRLDLSRQTLALGELSLLNPRTTVSRDAQGHWMAESWLKPAEPALTSAVDDGLRGEPSRAANPAGTAQAAATATPAAAPSPWQFKVDKLLLSGGQLAWRDVPAPGRPVQLDLSALSLQAGPLAYGQGAWSTAPVDVQWGGRISGRRLPTSEPAEPGRLDYRGTLKLAPLSTEGALEITRLPVQVLEPYFAQALNVEVLRAEAGYRGQIAFTSTANGPNLQLRGDAALESVRANSVLAHGKADQGPPLSEELLSWKALNVRGLAFAMLPAAPMALSVAETSLSDLYARVVVSADGSLNLQNLLRSPTVKGAQAGAPVASAARPAEAAAPGASGASAQRPRTAPAAPEPVIRLGPLAVVNARVLFSDFFIQPNYSASLTELTGRLGGFSSTVGPEGVQLADLELRGRAEGSAALEITGRLNPLAKPLALDIQGKMRDLDLPPLSPYAVKYAGYGIERGKLNADVAYRVQPDGQLTASNKVVLKQLSFGDPVAGAPNSLPVKLAVALLADSHGVIDLDLPVSGSLNDPDFKVGPIVGQLVLNLIGKALTSPFSLLGGIFRGTTGEMDEIRFEPGSAALSASSRATLDKLGQALIGRPGLSLTVSGRSQHQGEREAYRQQRLREMLLAAKQRAATQAGRPLPEPVTLEAAETPVWLKAAYQQSSITKPRNLLGLPKDLTDAEMSALLLASIPVAPDFLATLAAQRGAVVRDYLLAKQVPSDQLFLGAAKADGPEGQLKASAELKLEAR
ncbi:DUF748 domain-containing protein [Curvibacter sp. HBC61]|uniref:DUF748 domain-containing protein n=1 Tax=Curvibacter cyanobacteriorum TaxID=3026422 RepID=A0ABT5MXG2_9BURK|nr:DUF748 domain-containing protein [Curvibacter sp. HBC61]MDD0837981.1 DUF748 domain-containing protein [Curvibacter sp. HBC61]